MKPLKKLKKLFSISLVLLIVISMLPKIAFGFNLTNWHPTLALKHYRKPPPKPLPPDALEFRKLSKNLEFFDGIEAQGPMELHIISDAPCTKMVIEGPKILVNATLSNTHISSTSHLHVTVPILPYPALPPLKVTVYVPKLRRLSYKGWGSVRATHLTSTTMSIHLENHGPVSLSGKNFGIERLYLSGTGKIKIEGTKSYNLVLDAWGNERVNIAGEVRLNHILLGNRVHVSLFWVKSHDLIIRLYQMARLDIAGMADLLDAHVSGGAWLNARYLRTQESFIKSYQRARVDIQTSTAQHTLAVGTSNIYFHDQPYFYANYMDGAGSVLDMQNIPCLMRYDY